MMESAAVPRHRPATKANTSSRVPPILFASEGRPVIRYLGRRVGRAGRVPTGSDHGEGPGAQRGRGREMEQVVAAMPGRDCGSLPASRSSTGTAWPSCSPRKIGLRSITEIVRKLKRHLRPLGRCGGDVRGKLDPESLAAVRPYAGQGSWA